MLCLRSLMTLGLLATVVLSWETSKSCAADATPVRVRQRQPDLLVAIQQVAPRRARPSQASLAGGGQQTVELIGLIQGTVAPDSWMPTPNVAATAALGNGSPAALQLVNVIQENIQPTTWDVNGGLGTIMIVPW